MDNDKTTDLTVNSATGDEAAVSRLLGGLKRVAAPADFNFRVRAGIARREQSEPTGFRIPAAVRYAAGLGLVLAVFAAAGYVWIYSGRVGDVPAVAGVEDKALPPVIGEQPVVDPGTPQRNNDDLRVAIRTPEPAVIPPKAGNETGRDGTKSDPGTGTTDSSRTEATRESTRIYPKGINPTRTNINKPADLTVRGQIRANDVLSLLGIKSTFSADGWRVDSVTVNTTAERVGVKAGDVVEAIDDQPLKENTSFSGSVTGRSLRVRRGGQVVKIDLSNK